MSSSRWMSSSTCPAMRRRSRSTGRCTASIDPYQGSCPVARYLFHDDGTGARSEDSPAARLARPRVPGGLAVSDFPAAPHLSQRDRGRVRPFHPGSEAGPRDHLRARSDRAVRRTHRRPLEGESRGRGLGIPNSRARTRGRGGRAALPIRDRSVLGLDRLLRESLQRTLPLARPGCRDHRGNGPRFRGTRVSRRRTRARCGPVWSGASRRPGASRPLGGTGLTLVGGLDAEFIEALAGEIRDRRPASKDELERIKLRLARAHRLGGLPSDAAILQRIGHDTDKVDLIVLGGTFTALEAGYRQWFVKGCFDGLNGFEAPNLTAAQAANESAASRCIGLTIETKPDCFLGVEVAESLDLGATRVELGIQTTHEDVLARVHRGHTDAQSREAMLLAKDAGLKIGVHMMPGLPGSDPDRDMESFRVLFEDPAYRPDFLKIYPTLVLPGTALHALWKSGRYTPLSTEEAVELIARVKAIVPRWCRIQHLRRIPEG